MRCGLRPLAFYLSTILIMKAQVQPLWSTSVELLRLPKVLLKLGNALKIKVLKFCKMAKPLFTHIFISDCRRWRVNDRRLFLILEMPKDVMKENRRENFSIGFLFTWTSTDFTIRAQDDLTILMAKETQLGGMARFEDFQKIQVVRRPVLSLARDP